MQRKNRDSNLVKIGEIIRNHRKNYAEKMTMEKFIDQATDLLGENWISVRSLSNIENGYNLPSLITLKNLATALQVNLDDLIDEIKDYIPSK